MRYYFSLIWLFIRVSFQQEAAFRANFLLKLLGSLLTFLTGILGLVILFNAVPTVQGWTFAQTLTLLGIYLLINAILSLVLKPSLESMGGLGGDVWTGRFDYTLLAPANTQFLVSFRKWNIWGVIDSIVSLSVIGVGINMLKLQMSFQLILVFLLNLGVSLLIVYAISLLLTSVSVWYQGVPLTWIFENFLQLSRYPTEVYPGGIRLILTWLVPIGFITTVPVQALIGRASIFLQLGGLVIAGLLYWLAIYIFRRSLRRYSSASS